MKRLLIAGAVAALTASGAAHAQEMYGWTPAGTVTPTPPAPAYLMLAGAGDLYEIESSRLVLESTSDAALRRFAQMMIEHHTGTMRAAEAAAREAGATTASMIPLRLPHEVAPLFRDWLDRHRPGMAAETLSELAPLLAATGTPGAGS